MSTQDEEPINPINLMELMTKTKTTPSWIGTLLFGDEAALVAHDETKLQIKNNQLSEACSKFSLTIGAKNMVIS